MMAKVLVLFSGAAVGSYGFIAFLGALWFFGIPYDGRHLLAGGTIMILGYTVAAFSLLDTWNRKSTSILGAVMLVSISLFISGRFHSHGVDWVGLTFDSIAAACGLFVVVAPFVAAKGQMAPNKPIEPTR